MAAWECKDCTTVYSVDALRCPQCGSQRYAEQGSDESLAPPGAVELTAGGGAGGEDFDES